MMEEYEKREKARKASSLRCSSLTLPFIRQEQVSHAPVLPAVTQIREVLAVHPDITEEEAAVALADNNNRCGTRWRLGQAF